MKLYIICKYNIEIDVRQLKKVAYGEEVAIEDYEKEAYDTYNMFTYLLDTKCVNKLINNLNIDEKIIDVDDIVKSSFNLYKSNLEIVKIFMIMNYLLLQNHLPIINQYKKLNEFNYLFQLNDEEKFYDLINSMLIKIDTLDKNFYEVTRKTNKELIISFILDNKNVIKEKGHISSILLFGSYASELVRYDSDIDLLVFTNDDLTFDEKEEGIRFVKKIIEDRFNRIVDIHETTNELLTSLCKKIEFITVF